MIDLKNMVDGFCRALSQHKFSSISHKSSLFPGFIKGK